MAPARQRRRPWGRTVTGTDDDQDRIAIQIAEALRLPGMLASLPASTTSLTIVPDDVLNGFPFAAMKIGDCQLVDRFALSIGFENAPSRRPAPIDRSDALLVAVTRGSGDYPELPQTFGEVQRVRHWLDGRGIASNILVDEDATKANVMKGLREASLFHVACHGKFVPDRPDDSGMVLLPDSNRMEVLSLRDLSQMHLSKCRHVTLSSCWAADNFILPGRWIVSLPETLHRAGAHSILACPWPVDDEVAEVFMSRFYERLGTLPRAQALRHTQIECRDGRLPGCSHIDTSPPFYWAGFTLFGEAGTIDL